MSMIKDEKELLRDSPVSSLNEIAYQLAGLYERWAVEHQHVARREAEMARLLESFEEILGRLDSSGEKMHGVIKQAAKESAVMVGEITGQSMKDCCRTYFQEKLDPLMMNFRDILDRTKENLTPYASLKDESLLERWVTAVVVGVLSGVFVSALMFFLLK
jgi:hypothetical protein